MSISKALIGIIRVRTRTKDDTHLQTLDCCSKPFKDDSVQMHVYSLKITIPCFMDAFKSNHQDLNEKTLFCINFLIICLIQLH